MSDDAAPLTPEERLNAFQAIVATLDRACCVGVASIGNEDEHHGVTVTVWLSADRCRRWAAQGMSARQGENSRSEVEGEARQPGPPQVDAPNPDPRSQS